MKTTWILIALLLTGVAVNAQWIKANSGTTVKLNDVYFLNEDTGFVVGENLTILKTVNGGSIWSSATVDASGLSATGTIKKIAFNSNGSVGLASGTLGNDYVFLRSTDRGNTWSKTSFQVSGFSSINAFAFYDSLQVLAVGDSSELYYSGNAGNDWTMNAFNGFNRSITDISCKNGECVACLTSGSVYNTTSANGAWNIIKQTDSISLKSIFSVNTDTIMAVGQTANASYLVTTYNGGASWLPPLDMQVENINDIYFGTATTGYAVGGSPVNGTNSQYIATSSDAGFVWAQQNEASQKELFGVFFLDAQKGYAVGDSGTILRTNNGGITGIGHKKINKAEVKMFPNPTAHELTIESNKQAIDKVMLYDLSGKMKITQHHHTISNNTATINMAHLPVGMYFCHIVFSDGAMHTQKVFKE
jgi:photosystem II stability/assembly factor-like uncharacterized protein